MRNKKARKITPFIITTAVNNNLFFFLYFVGILDIYTIFPILIIEMCLYLCSLSDSNLSDRLTPMSADWSIIKVSHGETLMPFNEITVVICC